jgi:hypothetical protein
VGRTSELARHRNHGGKSSRHPASGFSGEPLGRGTLAQNAKTNIKTDQGHIKIKTKGPVETVTMRFTIVPGGTSGWHSHPGPNINIVTQGEVTLYHVADSEGDDDDDDSEADDDEATGCTFQKFGVGKTWFGPGPESHVARNEGTTPAIVVTTFIVPVGAALRIDQPQPANCTVT